MPARSSWCERRASRSSLQAISSSVLRRRGTSPRLRLMRKQRQSSTASRTGRSTRSRGARRPSVPTTEYDIQQLMAGWFRDEGLVSDSDPNVSAEENAGNPHYLPTASASRAIRSDELVLLDLWGKLDRPGAVYADITWMGYTGQPCARPVRRGVRGRGGRPRCRDRARSARRLRRARNCAAGRWIGRHPRCCAAPDSAIASCTGRVTASASRCTATALTWTTTRRTTIGGCSSAQASRSSLASTSTTSVSGRKSI